MWQVLYKFIFPCDSWFWFYFIWCNTTFSKSEVIFNWLEMSTVSAVCSVGKSLNNPCNIMKYTKVKEIRNMLFQIGKEKTLDSTKYSIICYHHKIIFCGSFWKILPWSILKTCGHLNRKVLYLLFCQLLL